MGGFAGRPWRRVRVAARWAAGGPNGSEGKHAGAVRAAVPRLAADRVCQERSHALRRPRAHRCQRRRLLRRHPRLRVRDRAPPTPRRPLLPLPAAARHGRRNDLHSRTIGTVLFK
jgi:hypothetical protein